MGSIITENKYVFAFYLAVMNVGTAIKTPLCIHWIMYCIRRARGDRPIML